MVKKRQNRRQKKTKQGQYGTATSGQPTVGLSADPRGCSRSATRAHRGVEWGQTRVVLPGESAGRRVLPISDDSQFDCVTAGGTIRDNMVI